MRQNAKSNAWNLNSSVMIFADKEPNQTRGQRICSICRQEISRRMDSSYDFEKKSWAHNMCIVDQIMIQAGKKELSRLC